VTAHSATDEGASPGCALVVAALLAAAAVLRLAGLDWDEGQHLHPDERFLTMVETAIRLPHSFAEYFDTARAPLNPANHGYQFFAYGTLPLFLVRALGEGLGLTDYAHIYLVGRAVSALFDLGTVWLTYWIGAAVASRRVGLIACALTAFSVTSIQNAHFFTVDSTATFFATAALCALVRFADRGSVFAQILFGVLYAMALACRINLVLLAGLYPAAFLYAWLARGRSVGRLAGGALGGALASTIVFRLVEPYAFAGPGFFGLAIAPSFVESLREIRSLVAGELDYPPSVQWIGRTPLFFPAGNVLVWGIGPAWGLAALVGLVWGFLHRADPRRERAGLGRMVLAWGLAFFAYHAWQFAPTGRYFLPVVPVLGLAAAWVLGGDRRPIRAAAWTVVALTAAWAVAFTAIYRRPITRVEASRWIYRHVPAGSTLATEHWDDALPLRLRGEPQAAYRMVELHLYDEDTEAKRRTLVEQLAAADYVVLSSNRLYRSIPRAPWRYPLTRRYYELLFSGELGFRLVRSFTSYPRLGSFEIPDDDAEEAFTVYDHPRVLIFAKTSAFSRDKAERLLGAVSLSTIVRAPPQRASALYRRTRPADVPLPESGAVRTAVAARGAGSLEALLRWVATLEALGLASFALLSRGLRGTPDRGFGLAKVLAWLAPGYGAWLLCSLGLAANTSTTARAIGIAWLGAGGAAAWRQRDTLREGWRASMREIAVVEAVFLGVFALFVTARAFQPAIYWGEKPMDFALLNSLLRSPTMPPADPWFAGATLNYFYFGHALVAFFARLTDVPPALAFNLAIGTVAGLLAVASFLVGRRLGGGALGGLLAALAVTLLGNLDGVRLFVQAPHRSFNFDYFWATSRVVRDTINEFPVWNLLFADLHAHVLAQPLEVALLYVGLLWLPSAERSARPPRLLIGGLAAWLVGAVAATSAWSLPTIVALQLAFLVTAAGLQGEASGRIASLLRALAWWLFVIASSRLLFQPFWASYRRPTGRSWGWEASRAPLGDVLTIFGVFLIVLLPPLADRWLARRERRWFWPGTLAAAVSIGAVAWLRSPSAGLFLALGLLGAAVWCIESAVETRATALLAAVAGGLGLVTETVFLWDRMNTVFKYYLEAWLLLACAAGGILPLSWHALRRGGAPWRVAVVAAGCAGLFTAASGAVALIRSPFVPSDVPTLDGMEYLEHVRPDELAAYRWLDRQVTGVPVILEAHGDSYGEFSRVSMNTGLPTVLGWEYHLFQQARSRSEIEERRADVRTLYSTTDWTLAEQLMRKYHVDLVFVGALERRTYPPAGLDKFATWPVTERVFTSGGVTIFATPGSLRSARSWIEEAPRSSSVLPAPPFGSFSEPRGLARARDGVLYVADFGNGRIQRLAADLGALGGFGAPGSRLGEFHDPCDVAVDAGGSLYVADTWNHRVQKLSAAGEPLAAWTASFYGPRGVALDRGGRIYVADTGNNRVVRLDPRGNVERVWGARDLDLLRGPVGIAVSAANEVYVADVGHRRVAVFSSDGELRRSWPIEGWAESALPEPHLDVGPDGVVWVSDPSGNRVLLFDGSGRPLGAAGERLSTPVGIAVIEAGRAVVANAGSHSLTVVSRTRNTAVAPER
jgi:YYY domain-containing protein